MVMVNISNYINTSHLRSLNTNTTATYVDKNPVHSLEQAPKWGGVNY